VGQLLGIRNPSFTVVDTGLVEVTEVKVPYYYKVEVEHGEYDVSANHPILTLSDEGLKWKRPAELRDGRDYVVTGRIEGIEDPIITFKADRISVPRRFEVNLALLLGLIAGDGYVGHDNVTFANSNKKLRELFKSLTNGIFNIEKWREYDGRVVIYSRELVKFLNHIGFKTGKKNYRGFLKKRLIKFSPETYTSFLLGLILTDGTIMKHSIVIYSTDADALKLIRDIGYSRGVTLYGPYPHKNKLSNMYKLILRGKYNLSDFKNIVLQGNIPVDILFPDSLRSYEYIPPLLMKIIKRLFTKYGIKYSHN